MADDRPTIAILGGTGDLGTGLAIRWLAAGYEIVVGSRSAEKAEAAAAELSGRAGGAAVRGFPNRDAARAADVVVLTVPYAHHRSMLEDLKDALQGKILIDVTVPLVPPKVARVQLPAEGCAAKAAQDLLGDGVRVVSAFQNVAADHLAAGHDIDCDVLVCGNDADARQTVVELAEAASLRAWHAGAIDNSAAAEALTSILIFMNRRYKFDGAGIRITGEPHAGDAD